MQIPGTSNTMRLFLVGLGGVLAVTAGSVFISVSRANVPVPQILQEKQSGTPSSGLISDNVGEKTPTAPRLTMQNIFDNRFQKTETSAEVLFVGDTGLVRSINAKTVSRDDFLWPFVPTADMLKRADLAVVNLEGPLVPDCPVSVEGMVFCGSPKNVEGLLFAGVDIANIANNHIGDYGEAGYKSTVEILRQNTILPYGSMADGKPEIALYEKGGTTYAFIGFNQIYPDRPYIAKADDETVRSTVAEATLVSDIVIVTFHWGEEYTDKPSEDTVLLAHAAVEAGANLVIGHHPHWIQSVEIYQNVPILYSLGNFVFDQMWSQKTREGLIAQVSVDRNTVLDINLIPVIIEDYGQPRFADTQVADRILGEVKRISIGR